MVDDCNCNDMTHEEMVHQIEDQTLPFTETAFEGYTVRTFDPKAPAHLYKWHFDEEDRTIEVLEDGDWQFQYDNEMPIPVLTGVDIFIPKGVYHRLIPGKSPLSIKIVRD